MVHTLRDVLTYWCCRWARRWVRLPMVAESTSRARMKRVVAVFTFGFLRASILGQLPPKFDLAFHCKLLSRRPLSPDSPVENEKVKSGSA